MGRAPDHVASCISGMYMGLDVFEAYDGARAKALADYYRYARDHDLYLTYVIINPQADRSKSASQQKDEFLAAGVVDRDASGVTVRGAKMLATGGILANEVFVTCIQPLQPGDEKHALSFAMPMNTKGLKILSRKSYEEEARSIFDNPLSSRFDENDAVLYLRRRQGAVGTGLRHRQPRDVPEAIPRDAGARLPELPGDGAAVGQAPLPAGHRAPHHRGQRHDRLPPGPRDAGATGGRGRHGRRVRRGHGGERHAGTGRYFVPDRHTLYAALTLTQKLYAKVLNTLRELAGGGMIMLPSSLDDFANPEIADLIEKTQQSPAASARTGEVLQARLGRGRLGVRLAPRPVRDVLFGRELRDDGPFLSHL